MPDLPHAVYDALTGEQKGPARTTDDAFCSNPECGAFWTLDNAFGWLKSEDRAVAFGAVGTDWREKVEKMEKGA